MSEHNQDYTIRIEFDRYSKTFEHVSLPGLLTDSEEPVLSFIEKNGMVHAYNWSNVQSYHYHNNGNDREDISNNPVNHIEVEFERFTKNYDHCETPYIGSLTTSGPVVLSFFDRGGKTHIYNWSKAQACHYKKED